MAAEPAVIIDAHADIATFFRRRLDRAISHQGVAAQEETLCYLVQLLASFTRTHRFPDGWSRKPLAMLYADALEAPSHEDRNRALKQLGDIALFVAGVFADSLNRKPVDVDYYIAMGGNAYDHLSATARHNLSWQCLSVIFAELAEKFTLFVDVLGEVSEQAPGQSNRDVLRLYEVWVRTGSPRAARQLRELGLQPTVGSISRRHH